MTEVFTLEAAPDGLDRVEDSLGRGWTEVLDALVPIIQNGERSIFLEERSPGGNPWAPLAASTIARKGFSKILVETGRLFESLTTPGGTTDTHWETSEDPIVLVFGTKVEYAQFHQTGTRRMPARPAVGLTQAATDGIVATVADAAAARIAGS